MAMKKFINVLLIAMMVFVGCISSPIDVCAEEKEEPIVGKTFRLDKFEGEVEIRNASGKKVKFKEGRKLYNGYTVTTEDGYAWISIDKDRMFKMDNDTQITVQRKKRKMNILIKKGNLFFAINKPLEEDEGLSIRTSTMSTGIRGTLGIVSVTQRNEYFKDTIHRDSLNLMEGEIELSYYNDIDEEIVTEIISAGEVIDIDTVHREAEEVANIPVSVSKSNAKNLTDTLKEHPFVLVEARDNEVVYKRLVNMETTNKEELDELIGQTDELLDKKHQETTEKRDENNRADNQIKQELDDNGKDIDPFFKDGEETDVKPVEPTFPVKPEVKPTPTPVPTPTPTPSPNPTPTPVPTPTPGVITVTFEYDGKLFASQNVNMSNHIVIEPILMPTAKGYWSTTANGPKFDFETKVNQEINLVWVDQSVPSGN